MSLMLWQEAAKNCTYKRGAVLTIHGVEVVYYGNARNSSAISTTTILCNVESPKATKLKEFIAKVKAERSESSNAESS